MDFSMLKQKKVLFFSLFNLIATYSNISSAKIYYSWEEYQKDSHLTRDVNQKENAEELRKETSNQKEITQRNQEIQNQYAQILNRKILKAKFYSSLNKSKNNKEIDYYNIMKGLIENGLKLNDNSNDIDADMLEKFQMIQDAAIDAGFTKKEVFEAFKGSPIKDLKEIVDTICNNSEIYHTNLSLSTYADNFPSDSLEQRLLTNLA